MSIPDALQLMFTFGSFIILLIGLIIELIKKQQK